MKALYVHSKTDVGQVREVNEDAVFTEGLPDGGHLVVVCDGLGGHGGGDVASTLACDVIAARVREASREDPRQVLFEALTNADRAVSDASESGGSTVVTALIQNDRAWVAWMGDSRLLHIRDNRVIDRTRDHTRVADLIDEGVLSAAQADVHPDRHVVTRALGSGDANPDVWEEPVELQLGDALVLISDGVHDLVSEDELLQWVSGVDYRDAVESLVTLANERGGTDNITVAIVVVGTPRVGGTALPHASRTPAPAPFVPSPRPPAPVGRNTLVDAPPAAPQAPESPLVTASQQAEGPSAAVLALGGAAVLLALVLGLVGGFVLRGLIDPVRDIEVPIQPTPDVPADLDPDPGTDALPAALP